MRLKRRDKNFLLLIVMVICGYFIGGLVAAYQKRYNERKTLEYGRTR